MFQVKAWTKMPKWKPFWKYNFPGNTSVYVFITEIIWHNNWRSIIDLAIITVIFNEKTITNSKLQDSWKHVMSTYVNMSALLANQVPKVVHMFAQSIRNINFFLLISWKCSVKGKNFVFNKFLQFLAINEIFKFQIISEYTFLPTKNLTILP
jgi:hypothetical protein